MKKKIGIVTPFGTYNYGNRLQNFALVKVLEGMGYETITLIVRQVKKRPLIWMKNKLVKLKGKNSWHNLAKVKDRIIAPFNRKYIKTYDLTKFIKAGLVEEMDCFVVGSDQVWAPHFSLDRAAYFLDFAPQGKRVSYAASFGTAEVPEALQPTFRKYLSGMDRISVREQTGVEIVKQLTGRDAKLALDPTLLLDKKAWDELLEEEGEKTPVGDYVVVYLLDGLCMSAETRKVVKEYTEKHKCKVYNILGNNPGDMKGAEVPGVLGFVGLIRGAKRVFTDSFHACVFSIIYDVEFEVMKRKGADMSSRITNLIEIRKDIPKMRADSIKWLAGALGSEGQD